MRPWLGLLVLCVMLGVNGRAEGQSEPTGADSTELARSEFERGRAAYEAGAFEDALSAFQRAHQLTGDPQILFNVATVADRLRRDALALEAYEGYLAGYPAAPDRANVEARIAAIRTALAEPTPPVDAEPVDAEPVDAEPVDAEVPDETDVVAPPRRSGDGGMVLAITGGVLAAGGIGCLIAAAVETDVASRAETWAELRGPYERVPLVSAVGIIGVSLGVAIAAVGVGWLILGDGALSPVALRVGPGNLTVEGSF